MRQKSHPKHLKTPQQRLSGLHAEGLFLRAAGGGQGGRGEGAAQLLHDAREQRLEDGGQSRVLAHEHPANETGGLRAMRELC